MSFFEKIGRFINKQLEEWRMLHKAEKEYPNTPATFARAFARGIVHWALASSATVCLAVEGLYHGKWTIEAAAEDLFSVTWKIMAVFAIHHFFIVFLNKQLTHAHCLGYLSGTVLALLIFVWNLSEITQFTAESMVHYLCLLLDTWLWSKFFPIVLGPLPSFWDRENKNKE